MERNFFFYGHYSNKTSSKPSVNKKHSYYMGLSFALVSLFSLLSIYTDFESLYIWKIIVDYF